jgi:hypothetical protein
MKNGIKAEYISSKEAAELLGVDISHITWLAKNGKISRQKINGKEFIYCKEDILKLIKEPIKSGYISSKEAAELLRVSKVQIANLAKNGKIRRQPIKGNKYFYCKKDILKLRKNQIIDGLEYVSLTEAVNISNHPRWGILRLKEKNKIRYKKIGRSSLYCKEDIIKNKKTSGKLYNNIKPEQGCIYGLYIRDFLLYIGQTLDIEERLNGHRTRFEKQRDLYLYQVLREITDNKEDIKLIKLKDGIDRDKLVEVEISMIREIIDKDEIILNNSKAETKYCLETKGMTIKQYNENKIKQLKNKK